MSRIALLLFSVALFAQQPSGVAPVAGGANLPAQQIGANDLIAVSVYDSPELTRTVRVSADGLIRLPMLRNRIRAVATPPGSEHRSAHGVHDRVLVPEGEQHVVERIEVVLPRQGRVLHPEDGVGVDGIERPLAQPAHFPRPPEGQ